jgi:hypothetical protein
MTAHLAALPALLLLLTAPGWALLALSGLWRRFPGLQGWCVGIGLSIACYPVIFYTLRPFAPTLRLGPFLVALGLLSCVALSAWILRHDWRALFRFTALEWLAIALIALTLITRLLVIRDQPYPAWADSLHHTLLTHLTAEQGALPGSLEPYFAIPLGQYHLGLYALTASLVWLTGLPAHSALLLTAQVLNGLCGLGVFLALDRYGGRLAAVVGVAVVGLLSHQPAWYVNWGRFTQVASQTVLLIAWIVSWEALRAWREPAAMRRERYALIGLAAVLNAAVVLFHFRVAAFYLPLFAITVLLECMGALRSRHTARTATAVVLIGLASLLLVAPAITEALRIYLATPRDASTMPAQEVEQTLRDYFGFPLESIPVLAGRVWLLILSGIALLFAVLRRNQLAAIVGGWTALVLAIGFIYVLNIPVLAFTNPGAVLILLYLPIALLVGCAAHELVRLFARRERLITVSLVALVTLGAAVALPLRIRDIEPFRYFVTPADVAAADWIRANTPPDAQFAVNTTFWLPQAPHGTDGGYWLPYLAERSTTVGVMINSLGSPELIYEIVSLSRAEERLEHDPGALDELRDRGVDYIYIGPRGDFTGPGLRVEVLRETPGLSEVYDRDGVTIFQIDGGVVQR